MIKRRMGGRDMRSAVLKCKWGTMIYSRLNKKRNSKRKCGSICCFISQLRWARSVRQTSDFFSVFWQLCLFSPEFFSQAQCGTGMDNIIILTHWGHFTHVIFFFATEPKKKRGNWRGMERSLIKNSSATLTLFCCIFRPLFFAKLHVVFPWKIESSLCLPKMWHL